MFWASRVELCALRAAVAQRYEYMRSTGTTLGSVCRRFAFRRRYFWRDGALEERNRQLREKRQINLQAFDIDDDKKHRKAILGGS